MRRILMLFVCLPLAGCLVGASQGRSTTSVVRDTGVPGVHRTTVTSEHSGSSFGASLPMMMPGMGYGYGGGAVIVTGPSCALHPDRCAVISQQPVIQPTTVVSYGGSSGGGGHASVDVADLEARIERLEGSVQKLKGATKLTLRRSCTIITGTPDLIKDPAEREKIVAACTKVLSSDTNPSAPTSVGEEK